MTSFCGSWIRHRWRSRRCSRPPTRRYKRSAHRWRGGCCTAWRRGWTMGWTLVTTMRLWCPCLRRSPCPGLTAMRARLSPRQIADGAARRWRAFRCTPAWRWRPKIAWGWSACAATGCGPPSRFRGCRCSTTVVCVTGSSGRGRGPGALPSSYWIRLRISLATLGLLDHLTLGLLPHLLQRLELGRAAATLALLNAQLRVVRHLVRKHDITL
jgi:hypothetical protein